MTSKVSPIFSKLALALLLLTLFPKLCWSAAEYQVMLDLASLLTTNSRLSSTPYASFSPKGLHWCAKECKRRPNKCKSFNFVKGNLTCQLNDKSSSSVGYSVVAETDTFFGDSSSWPDNLLGPCDSLSCPATERCETNSLGEAICAPTECASAPPSVTNAVLQPVASKELGQAVTYTCSTGYTMQNAPATSVCTTAAQWSSPGFMCRDCGNPPSVTFATPTGSSRLAGSIMTYDCNGHPVENGPAQVMCNSQGNWETPTFSCIGYRTSVFGDSGTIVSPGYPGDYGHDLDETIYVTLSQSGQQTVYLTINYYLEEKDETDCHDYVEINGDGVHYCGEERRTESKTITVTGTWTVFFHTDYSVARAAGFLISYHL